MASRATTKLIRSFKADEPGFETEWRTFCRRAADASGSAEKDVRKILKRIREGGDAELLACIKSFDGPELTAIEVGRDEWDDACDQVNPADRAAIGKSAMRVREFHRKRIPSSWEVREEGGGYMGQKVRPLGRVGVYAAAGSLKSPSQVIMNVTPPSVVEVPEIIMATPPGKDGSVSPELLMAARVAGVHRIFKMGGAHAIAAMAYGTEQVPQVDKIVGVGGAHVTQAQRQIFGVASIQHQAGPTELCIVADRAATPAWIAADAISHAEKDENAQVVLITNGKGLATKVQEQVNRQLKNFPSADAVKTALSTRGVIVVTRNVAESIKLANEYAPEHLVLAIDEPEQQIKHVTNAGAVFLGHYTPVAVGDYLAGPNSVLPTGGTARFASPLGVEDFLKRMAFVKFESPKLRELGADVIRLAEVEGLSGSAKAVDLRLQKIRRARREREAAREVEMEL